MYEANHVERISHHAMFYAAAFGEAIDNHWADWIAL